MLMIEITYTQPFAEVEKQLQQHRVYLRTLYDLGLLLVSGPQDPCVGGMMIGLCDKEALQAAIEQDPFYVHKLADYRVIEFVPTQMRLGFKALLN